MNTILRRAGRELRHWRTMGANTFEALRSARLNYAGCLARIRHGHYAPRVHGTLEFHREVYRLARRA